MLHALFHDTDALTHLFHPHQIAIVVVPLLAQWHVKIQAIVDQIGRRLTYIVIDPGGAQDRPRKAQGDRIMWGDDAGAAHPVVEDAVFLKEMRHVAHRLV